MKKFKFNKQIVHYLFRTEASYFILIFVTVFSKILGFGRESVIAYKFGVSSDFDVFLVIFVVPNMVASLFVYAIPHIIMPKLALNERLSDSAKYYQDFASYFLWPLTLFAGIVCLIYFILIPGIISLLLKDINGSNLYHAIIMARFLTVYIFFSLLFSILKTLYDAEKKFVLPAFATFSIHFFVILSVLFLANTINVFSLIIGLILGSIVQVLVILISLKRTDLLKYFSFKLRKFDGLTASVILIVLIEFLGQTYTFIDRSFFASIPSGYISALNYAGLLYNLPVAIFAMTLGVVVFPNLNEAVISNNGLFNRIFYSSVKKVLLISIPTMLFFIFFNVFIIKILFQRGQFDTSATDITASMLKYYAFGLPFIMIHVILVKVFLSLKKEFQLLMVSLFGVLVKYLSLLFFVNIKWYQGLAFSTPLVYFFSVVTLVVILQFKKTEIYASN